MIDPSAAWSLGEELTRTGATITAVLGRVNHLLPDEDHLQLAGPSKVWWDSAAADLKQRVAALESAPLPAAGPEWLQGPPSPDRVASPPEAVAFFARLSPHQALRLAQRFPEQVGPLDGAPLAARYAANHLLVIRYLEELRHRYRTIAGGTGAGFGFTADDLWGLLRWAGKGLTDLGRSADEKLTDLAHRIADTERWVHEDRHYLLFDPSGDGRIIEVLGDLESSRHVAVVIPGVGNGIANYEGGLRHNAALLHDDAGRSDVAVIAWLGYDTPDDLLAATARHPVEAAASLSRLLAGVDLSIDHSLHVTVIGHSYGSLVVGEALRAGAKANEVVFIGSPGVGADHVSELGLAASTRVWAGRADSDPIGLARGLECLDSLGICYPVADRLFFGVDPTDPAFGATEFVVDDAPIREAHSSYFKQDSVSLHNLSSILLGRSPRVIRPGGRTVTQKLVSG